MFLFIIFSENLHVFILNLFSASLLNLICWVCGVACTLSELLALHSLAINPDDFCASLGQTPLDSLMALHLALLMFSAMTQFPCPRFEELIPFALEQDPEFRGVPHGHVASSYAEFLSTKVPPASWSAATWQQAPKRRLDEEDGVILAPTAGGSGPAKVLSVLSICKNRLCAVSAKDGRASKTGSRGAR